MLVGRQSELACLEKALERADHGAGSLVLLAGEAGVGKTRLAAALAAGSGALVLSGRAGRSAAAPYAPVVAALRSCLRSDASAFDGLGPLRPHLALLLPELGDPAPASDAATVSEAVRGAFAHLAREQTVLLLLDDLHWSDDATLELLAHARRAARPAAHPRRRRLPVRRPAARPRAPPPARTSCAATGAWKSSRSPRSALSETGELLAGILGDAPSPAIARAIHERARGVPFFVEELARATDARGWSRRRSATRC